MRPYRQSPGFAPFFGNKGIIPEKGYVPSGQICLSTEPGIELILDSFIE